MTLHQRVLPVADGVSVASAYVLSALLEARTGQQIAGYRSWRLDTALKPLMRERGVDTLDTLVSHLMDGTDHGLGDRIVDALLNGETSFFRDAAIWDLVAEAVTLAEEGGRRPRVWSAGCSTGQEPLSLAMMLAERAEASGRPMPEIVATDVSDAAITRARSGAYSQFEVQRGLPIRRMMRWFDGGLDGQWSARPDLLRLVHFRRQNLVADPAPAGPFDIVLCRNVLLYFSPEMKAQAFERFARALRPGGSLVLGAGETVIGQTPLFQPSARLRGFYERSGGRGPTC